MSTDHYEIRWIAASLTKSDKRCVNCGRQLCRGMCYYYDTITKEQAGEPFQGYLCDECGEVNEDGKPLLR